jgi:hypothetical protein
MFSGRKVLLSGLFYDASYVRNLGGWTDGRLDITFIHIYIYIWNKVTASVAQWSEFLPTDTEVWVRFPALPDFLRSSGSGTASTQPREYNWGATWLKSSGSCLENREYGRRGPSRWPRGTLYPQKLALTLPTSCRLSVSIVLARTQATEFFRNGTT